MQLFDDEAVCAGTGTADVLAQRQAGDHRVGGQRLQSICQRLRRGIVQLLGHGLLLQKQLCFGVVGQDQVCRAAQIADALDQRRGNSGIGLAVIAHHGVHHLVGGRPQGKGFFSQRYLCFAAQIAGIDTIKLQFQRLIVLQRGHAVGAAVHPGGGAQTAGVGGKHHRGQRHRLEAHDRQHGQDHCKAAPAYAGQIVDAKDLFWFNGFLQIGKPPCRKAARSGL